MTQFVIVGPVKDEEILYWNNDLETWVEFNSATTFNKEIMTVPLPPGGAGVMEITMNMEPVKFYQYSLPEESRSYLTLSD